MSNGGQNEIVWIIGGEYVFMCKACGQLGESGDMLPWEILILDLLLDAIWWNLALFSHKHNLPLIVSLNPLYYWYTCKIEFSAHPREASQSQGGKCPLPPPILKETLLTVWFVFAYCIRSKTETELNLGRILPHTDKYFKHLALCDLIALSLTTEWASRTKSRPSCPTCADSGNWSVPASTTEWHSLQVHNILQHEISDCHLSVRDCRGGDVEKKLSVT